MVWTRIRIISTKTGNTNRKKRTKFSAYRLGKKNPTFNHSAWLAHSMYYWFVNNLPKTYLWDSELGGRKPSLSLLQAYSRYNSISSASVSLMCDHVGILWKFAGSESIGLGWSLRFFIPKKVPGDANASGPQTTHGIVRVLAPDGLSLNPGCAAC